jgi:hypothetical protein
MHVLALLSLHLIDVYNLVHFPLLCFFTSPTMRSSCLITASLAATAAAQYFPPTPEGLKVVESKHHKGVKISYKEVRHIFL